MPLLETLTLTLAPVIAKSIVKMWLKDETIAADISSSLVDLLGKKVSDVVLRQSAKRQFEEAGEKIAISLLPLFEKSGMDESGQNAVILAICDTLSSAKLSADILAQQNLDPHQLHRYLTQFSPHNTYFSKAENDYYDRILEQLSSHIVDIVGLLPNFTERTLAEVLKREKQILEAVGLILEEFERIRLESQKANPLDEFAHYEMNYRLGVARILDRPDIFGLDSLSRSSQRYRISVAYISLSVVRVEHKKKFKDDHESEDEIIIREQVETVLASSKKLLVRGQAGSGKTTLLKWIAIHASGNSFPKELAEWNNLIPFFIPLRKFVDQAMPSPQNFVKPLLPEMVGGVSESWVISCLKSGRAIVLIDGIDEVPKAQRQEVDDWIEGLVNLYPGARFVISSRPYAVEEIGIISKGFLVADLQPMELPDIYNFINHWHEAVFGEIEDAEEKKDLKKFSNSLKNIVLVNRSIFNLATTPLLCAALCALNRDRNQQLPSNRIEVYEAVCYMLLEARERRRNLVLEQYDYPNLSYAQKRVILESLAYWMLLNGWSSVSSESVDRHIKQKLPTVIGLSQNVAPQEIRKLFIERSGILREPLSGSIDFVHRSMQEFLAAKALLDAEDIGVAGRHADDDQWQQVIILASGLAGPRTRERIIREVIQRGNKNYSQRHKYYMLAVACLDTAVELSSSFQGEIEGHLKEIIPPKSSTEARAIASAHDLAVPHLAYDKRFSESDLAFCIQALARIGTPLAYATLKGYVDDGRMRIVSELLMAEAAFSQFPYAREISAKLTADRLHLSGVTSLDSLINFEDLEYLRLSGSPHLYEIDLIGKLPNLKELHLEGLPRISRFEVLAAMENLTTLTLRALPHLYSHTDLELPNKLRQLFLEDMLMPSINLNPGLVFLSLTNMSRIVDLDFLVGTHLQAIRLDNLPNLKSLNQLAHLPNLRSLYLNNVGVISESAQKLFAINEKITDLEFGPSYGSTKFLGELRKSPIFHIAKKETGVVSNKRKIAPPNKAQHRRPAKS